MVADEELEDAAEKLRRKAQQLLDQAAQLDKLKEPTDELGAVITFMHNGYFNVAVRRRKGWCATGHLGATNKSLSWATMLERFPELADGLYKVALTWSDWKSHEA